MKLFEISSEFIPLIQLLKATRLANSGGEAQRFVEQGLVYLNGVQESRKRAKVRDGSIVQFNDVVIKVISKSK